MKFNLRIYNKTTNIRQKKKKQLTRVLYLPENVHKILQVLQLFKESPSI